MITLAGFDPERLTGVFKSLTTINSYNYIRYVKSFYEGQNWDQAAHKVVYQLGYGALIGTLQVLKVGGTFVVSFQSDEPHSGSIDAKNIYKPINGEEWSHLISVML